MVPFINLLKRSFRPSFFSPKLPKRIVYLSFFNFFNFSCSVFLFLQSFNIVSCIFQVGLSIKIFAFASNYNPKLVLCLNNKNSSRIHWFRHLFNEKVFHHQFCKYSCWVFKSMWAYYKYSRIYWNWIKWQIKSLMKPH